MRERSRKVRLLRLAALFVVLVGGISSVATGAWRDGFLGLSVSAGVLLFGVGEVVRGEDRAVARVLVIVGSCGILGHVGQILLFR